MDDMAGRHQPPAVAVSSSGGCSIGTPLADYESRTAECSVSIRIYVPELNIQKVLHFRQEELVWNVKQQCLATLPKVSPRAHYFHSKRKVEQNQRALATLFWVKPHAPSLVCVCVCCNLFGKFSQMSGQACSFFHHFGWLYRHFFP